MFPRIDKYFLAGAMLLATSLYVAPAFADIAPPPPRTCGACWDRCYDCTTKKLSTSGDCSGCKSLQCNYKAECDAIAPFPTSACKYCFEVYDCAKKAWSDEYLNDHQPRGWSWRCRKAHNCGYPEICDLMAAKEGKKAQPAPAEAPKVVDAIGGGNAQPAAANEAPKAAEAPAAANDQPAAANEAPKTAEAPAVANAQPAANDAPAPAAQNKKSCAANLYEASAPTGWFLVVLMALLALFLGVTRRSTKE